MEFRFFALFFFLPFFALAQGPKVPSKINFADMKLRIMDDARKEIQEDVDRLTRSPTYFNKQVELAKSYFPIIERVFQEENLPEDFKYLVLQESGLVSDAVSSSNAVGFWQFKDFTAMEVGLRVDRQVDERMNIVAASRGAARYMKKNNNSFFNNWLMSLQAYQMGPGTALKVGADKHRGEKSMTINKKTYWYVKKYLAHKIAYEDAINGEAQLKLIEHKAVANESLDDIAELYRVEEDEVEKYNKWLRKGRIPDDRQYTVIIPTENASVVPIVTATKEVVATTESSSMDYDLADSNSFPAIKDASLAKQGELVQINGLPGILARNGDKIPAVAALGSIELSKFLKYNDLAIDDQLIEGQVYYLKAKRNKARAKYHVAALGESLWGISQKYGVKERKLRAKNRMDPDEEPKEGRVIWLRYIRPAKIPIEYEWVEKEPISVQEVQVSDVSEITDTNSVLDETESTEVIEKPPLTFLEKLDSLDNLQDKVDRRIDQDSALVTTLTDTLSKSDLKVPILNANAAQDSVLKIHSVKAGETFYAISKRYEVNVLDLLEWNDLTINDKLSIDQKIKVYTRPEQVHKKKPEESEKIDHGMAEFTEYVVKQGDTLYSIARENDVKVEDLLDWNGKKEANIKLGEILKIKNLKTE